MSATWAVVVAAGRGDRLGLDQPKAFARLNGRHVIASISGGKDSAAMSLYLAELGIPHERIFLDTGWEHERTYEYLSGELARVLGRFAKPAEIGGVIAFLCSPAAGYINGVSLAVDGGRTYSI